MLNHTKTSKQEQARSRKCGTIDPEMEMVSKTDPEWEPKWGPKVDQKGIHNWAQIATKK